MFEPPPKELTNVRQFIREAKFNEALQILEDFETLKRNSPRDIVLIHLLKCGLFFEQGLFKRASELAEKVYNESLGLENKIFSVDALLIRAHALLYSRDLETANKCIEKGESLLNSLTELPDNTKNRRMALLFYLKGLRSDPDFAPPGDVALALKYYNHSLTLAEPLHEENRVIASLIRIAWNISFNKGDLELGYQYVERALALARDLNYKLSIIWALLIKASICNNKGEVTRALPLYEESLKGAIEINHKYCIATNFNNMADAYRMKGDLEHAIECSKQAIQHISETGDIKPLAIHHDFLIQLLIEKGDLDKAQKNLNKLEQLNIKLKDRDINEVYLYNKALLLKESPRIMNRAKAEEIFKQILKDKNVKWEINLRVLLALSDLLLSELQITGDLEVLEEIKYFISQLLKTAEESRSYWIWGENFLLQAKLALTSLNLKEARRLLTQGQRVAEKFGLNLLAKKISHEHDELLIQLKIWENLKESETSLPERMKLARLNEQMEIMIKKRSIEVPELLDEESVLLLIISGGGTPFFSHTFIEDQSFEDHLFGGFLSAINSFAGEMFSEGLDRVSFGNHTIIMNAVSPFFVCYIFKGQSYSAQHRIKSFINEIQSDKEIWDTFEKFYQINREIQIKDVPSLEYLIKEIFIDKKVPLTR